MAIIKAVSSKATINTAIEYVTKEEKTEKKLVSGYNCQPESAAEEMQLTKEAWQKTDGRTYKHFVQSFHKDEPITPELAHKIANEFVEKCPQFQGFEVLIATHEDKEHIHTHFIVNSVSYKDGHKFQQSRQDLKKWKEISDEIIKKHGLKVVQKGKTYEGKDRDETSTYTKEAYRRQKKAEAGEVKSYVQNIALAVLKERENATSKDEFIANLQSQGIVVDWQESHKYITFIDLARQEQGEKQCKIRDNKITKYYNIDVSKETLINEFERNGARAEQLESAVTELRDFDQRTERKTSQAGARAESGEIKKSESAGTNAELQNAVRRGRRTEARASDPRETDKRIGEFRRTMESAGRTMEQAGNSLLAMQRSITAGERESDGIEQELAVEQQLIETIFAGISDLTTDLEKLGNEIAGASKEQSRATSTAEQPDFWRAYETIAGNRELAEELGAKADRNGEKADRVGKAQRNNIGKQQELGREQSSIADRVGGLADRIREFADKLKEAITRPFRKGGR